MNRGTNDGGNGAWGPASASGVNFYDGKPRPIGRPEDRPKNSEVKITQAADPEKVAAYHLTDEYKRRDRRPFGRMPIPKRDKAEYYGQSQEQPT